MMLAAKAPKVGIVAILLTLVMGLLAAPAGVAQEGGYAPPRTPWGAPDLTGAWSNKTTTPLERPAELADQAFLTEEERAARNPESGVSTEERSAFMPTGAYNDFWLEQGELNLRTSLVVDPPDGRIPRLREQAQRRAAERAEAQRQMGGRWDAAQNNELDDRCIMMNAGPPVLPGGYNNTYQIVQEPGYVAILVEMIHDVRLIPLDERPPISDGIRQWMGNSRGRWEGDTLVVETTNFTGKTAFRGSGSGLRLVERFTRVAEDTLLYSFTAEDPETWARPWTAEVPMQTTLGPVVEFACHEGNYSMYNALRGARADEDQAAEDAAKLEVR